MTTRQLPIVVDLEHHFATFQLRYSPTLGRQREAVLRFGGTGDRSGGTWMYDLGHLIELAAADAPEFLNAELETNPLESTTVLLSCII